jgi:hypothetical protein
MEGIVAIVITFTLVLRPIHGMSRSLPIREASFVLASVLLGTGTGLAYGQAPAIGQPPTVGSSLPAAQPSTASPAGALSTASGVSTTAKPETKLDVTYADGILTVNTTNASLGQVLRQISQKTGMKISGSAGEDSVFGQYGPSPVSEVLASLLDGTGSNMLLVDNKSGPAELILTPRRGGASPPSANAGNYSRNDAEPQDQQYVPPVRPFQPPTATGRGPVTVNQDGSPSFAPPVGFGQGGSPNGGEQQRTPQQIYEQLQQQGAQQQQAPPQE